MIRVLIYLLIILVGLCLSPYIVGNTGYLYIAAGEYQIETSLVFAIFGLIVFYSLLQLAEWLVIGGLNLVLNSRYLPERWRKNAARKYTLTGALALAEEDWPAAEKAMAKGAAKGETPALNLLAAARAAHHQHNTQTRDEYLDQASQQPLAAMAVNTTRTRYLLQQGDIDKARTELDALTPTSRSKTPVLQLALEIYQAQHDWQALKLLLPIIQKRKMLAEDDFNALTEKTNAALLRHAGSVSEQELDKCWHWLSRAERNQTANMVAYALGLCRYQRKDEALKMLIKRMKAEPNNAILRALPLMVNVEDSDARKQLQGMATQLTDNAEFHICMAKMYQQSRDFKEAKQHWQTACQLHSEKSSWLALGQLQEQLGEQFNALHSYRNAAQL